MDDAVTAEQRARDLDAIRQAALDYMQGWYEGDAERMRRSLHPELAKRAVLRDPQTGKMRFNHLNQQQMISKTAQGGGAADVPAEKRYYAPTILDLYGDVACARAESYEYIDFLHLARGDDGAWQIVNVLWTENLAAR